MNKTIERDIDLYAFAVSMLYETHREKIHQWVRDHGLQPADVPVTKGSRIAIRNGEVTFPVFMRSEAGKIQWDPDTNGPKVTSVTVPLKRPWPVNR